MAGTGGKREGAGRPKGGVNALKRTFRDYFTEKEVVMLINKAKLQLDDPYMLKFCLEQLFGKAPQRMELTGANGTPLSELSSAIQVIIQREQ